MSTFKVDYESFPGAVSTIRSQASELNSELTSAFKAIEETHSVWTGNRYNELAKKFSDIVTDVNDILSLVVTTIPYTLEQIANNYEAADNETDAVAAKREEPTKVSVTVPGKEILYIDSSAVDPYKSTVKTALENAKGNMNSIESTVSGLTWEGQSSETYKGRLTKLKTSLSSAFDDINSSFDVLASAAQAEFEKAEAANNIL